MTLLNKLTDWFEGKGRVLVALSGGVDSGLVALGAFTKLHDSALAITADYKTLAKEELESASNICSEIGIQHIIINYDELENQDFVRNDKNRCFYCRTELAEYLKKIAKKYQIQTIVDGTNIDDLGDYRPGISALQMNGIRSPLVEIGFSKNDVRETAKKAGLSVYDRPSNSCLASRIPWGQRVTAEKLTRIELGELIIKQTIKAKQVRVRDMNGSAKIEVDVDSIESLSNKTNLDEIRSKLQLIGFTSVTVDQDGYKPGKINVMVD